MNDKKYPIGTNIKYIGFCKKCKGEIGKVVDTWSKGYIIILPQSLCDAAGSNNRLTCSWSDIVMVPAKRQQLLFSFME